MPLSPAAARREIHERVIEMRAYEREDGLFDVESRLTDRKPFPFKRPSSPDPLPAGQPLHDLSLRVTLDRQYTVRAIEASSDITPWALCKEAEAAMQILVGQTIGRGWSAVVKERLRGAAGCTHLMEMLIPLATVAFQGMRPVLGQSGSPGHLVDSCYALSSERAVARMLWPELALPPRPAEGSFAAGGRPDKTSA